MDKNKLEISGKTSPDSVSATYKPIPEKDMEDEAVSSRPKSLVKVKEGSEIDGAHEKMLPVEENVPEVVMLNNDSKSPQNGDVKFDIAEPKQAFVGLTKEELMKYANDPFWIRLRWFLFISFWLLWAAMLVGAVLIIYAAPKCDPPPPRTWYQQGPLAQLQPDTQLENLKLDQNIQGLLVPWYGDAYQPLENSPQDLALLKTAQSLSSNVIVVVDPTFSKVWFERSENRDPEYEGYYIWRPGTFTGSGSKPSPPNRWLGPSNVTSWTYSETRKEYYYSPFTKPHLNFRNESVIKEFNKVMDRFLMVNVSGLSLRNAAFLLVDPSFGDEDLDRTANLNSAVSEYTFYRHSKTQDLPELGGLLKQWRSHIRNISEAAPLMVAEPLGRIDSYKVNNTLMVDLPLVNRIFSKPTLSVRETANNLHYILNITSVEWPLWEAKTTALPQDVLNIVTYLLPGAPLINITDTVSADLLKIRTSPSIMRGTCGVFSLRNNTILAFIRETPGSPGILVMINPTDETAIANVREEIPPLTKLQEVTISHYSNNYNESYFQDVGGKRGAGAIPVTPKSAIVLEYVPKKDE